jgi:hypothetical protein
MLGQASRATPGAQAFTQTLLSHVAMAFAWAAHVPQVYIPLHPSETMPQFFPAQAVAIVVGVQGGLHMVPAELQPVDEHNVLVGVGHWPLPSQTCAAVCVPLVQVWAVPQDMPADLLPVETQTCLPVAQEYVPFLQPVLSGEHPAPAAHATQAPALHTIPVPQGPPLATIPVSVQTSAPVLQEPETV